MRRLLSRLVVEERAQDLLEYALLAALVATAGYAALQLLELALRTAYIRWDTDTQAVADVPSPGGS